MKCLNAHTLKINKHDFVSPNKNESIISSNESTSLILPLSIRQTISSNDDIPLRLHATSYVDLQP